MSDLRVFELGKELRTDSRLLAPVFDYRHRIIRELIGSYFQKFQELGPLPFETEEGKPLPQGGYSKGQTYYLLNWDQCAFLMALMRNNDQVVEGKLRLVQAFKDARAQLAERDMARLDSKTVRRREGEAIRLLVEYANGQGSQNAEMYYTNVTKMTNHLLGIEPGRRDEQDEETLKQLSMVETMVDMAIRDGIRQGLSYRDIYRLAKHRASQVANVITDQSSA